jgi:hypothetical protein
MVVYLRHKEQIVRVRTSPTCECDGQFTPPENLSLRGFRFAHCAIRHLAPPSVPLFSASPRGCRTGAGSRGQGCFYGEVTPLLDSPSPPASRGRTGRHQPVGGRSLEAVLALRSRPWTNVNLNAKFVVKINITMIVCHLKSCRRFIIGWCPTNPVESQPPN